MNRNKIPPPSDLIEAMGEAYELLLEKSLDEAHRLEKKTGPALHRIIDKVAEETSALGELSKEEAARVAGFLKRDLTDAAHFMHETGRSLKDWLGFDLMYLEDRLRDLLFRAADQTTVELMALKEQAMAAEYHTGEIAGPGNLICDKCGEKLHFEKPGHIPPCPKCRATVFHREGWARQENR